MDLICMKINVREEETLIKNVRQTAVIKILKTSSYELDVSYSSQDTFPKGFEKLCIYYISGDLEPRQKTFAIKI